MTKLQASIVFSIFFVIFVMMLSLVNYVYNYSPFVFIIGIITSALWLAIALTNLVLCFTGTHIKVRDRNRIPDFEQEEEFAIFFPCPDDQIYKINTKDNIFSFNHVYGDRCSIIQQSFGVLIGRKINFELDYPFKPYVVLSKSELVNVKGSGLLIIANGNLLKFKEILNVRDITCKSLKVNKGNLSLVVNYKQSVENMHDLRLLLDRQVMLKDDYIPTTSVEYVTLYDLLLYELTKSYFIDVPPKDKKIEDWIKTEDGKLTLFLLDNSCLRDTNCKFLPYDRAKQVDEFISSVKNYIRETYVMPSEDLFQSLYSKVKNILTNVCSLPYFAIHENYILNDGSRLSGLMLDHLQFNQNREMLKCIFAIASYQYNDSYCQSNEFIKELFCNAGCIDVLRNIHGMLGSGRNFRFDDCLYAKVTFDSLVEELQIDLKEPFRNSERVHLIDSARRYIERMYAPYVKPYYDIERLVVGSSSEIVILVGEKEKSLFTGVDVSNAYSSPCSISQIN